MSFVSTQLSYCLIMNGVDADNLVRFGTKESMPIILN
jgi:hypothetical protein